MPLVWGPHFENHCWISALNTYFCLEFLLFNPPIFLLLEWVMGSGKHTLWLATSPLCLHFPYLQNGDNPFLKGCKGELRSTLLDTFWWLSTWPWSICATALHLSFALSTFYELELHFITSLGPASLVDYNPLEKEACLCLALYSTFSTSSTSIDNVGKETAPITLTLQDSCNVT